MSEEQVEKTDETPDVPEVLAPGLAMALPLPKSSKKHAAVVLIH